MRAAVVGVVANPASGRDVRRLVSDASVFDNAEKGAMVARLLAGLGAAGVDCVRMMPAGDGLLGSLQRHLRGRTGQLAAQPLPDLELLALDLTGGSHDTRAAVDELVAEGVAALVVLGGDGTCRVVAERCGATPLLALSTGTNNVFPVLGEATVAGLAVGLVATGRADGDGAVHQHRRLAVRTSQGRVDSALVDVATCRDRVVGARALTDPRQVREAVVATARADAVGLAGVAGQLAHDSGDGAGALHLVFADADPAPHVVTATFAPGLVLPVGIADVTPVPPHTPIVLAGGGCLALDGEREHELAAGEDVTVTVQPGPRVIDARAVLAQAAHEGLLTPDLLSTAARRGA